MVTAKLADDRRRLRRLSVTDDLTGLYNLRGLQAELSRIVRIARAADSPGMPLARTP
jgi:PleD family two-component response regulator